MYTEIELSEFTIRARLKLGDFAEEITEKLQHGVDVDDLIEEAAVLRIFLNTVNSDTQTWATKNLYKRVEYFTDVHDLIDKPGRPREWNNKFKAVPSIVRTGANYIQLPRTGEGYVYYKDGEVSLISSKENTINDLPNG